MTKKVVRNDAPDFQKFRENEAKKGNGGVTGTKKKALVENSMKAAISAAYEGPCALSYAVNLITLAYT